MLGCSGSWGRGAAPAAGQDHGAGTQTPPRPTRDKDPLLPQLGVSQIPWASCPISLPHLWNTRISQDCPPWALGGSKEAAVVISKLTTGVLCLGAMLPSLKPSCLLVCRRGGSPSFWKPPSTGYPFPQSIRECGPAWTLQAAVLKPPETLRAGGPRQGYLIARGRDATGLRSLPGQEARGRRAE